MVLGDTRSRERSEKGHRDKDVGVKGGKARRRDRRRECSQVRRKKQMTQPWLPPPMLCLPPSPSDYPPGCPVPRPFLTFPSVHQSPAPQPPPHLWLMT